jgi:hypothetical protein
MAEKRYPNGRIKQLRGAQDLEANLWKVWRVTLTESSEVHLEDPPGSWTVTLWTREQVVYTVTFKTREAAWDWLHRPALKGVPLHVRSLGKWYTADPKNKGNYPW